MKTPSLKTALSHIFLTASLAIGVMTVAASAQPPHSSHSLTVKVPFAFNTGSDLLPAGDYRIDQFGSHTIVLRSANLAFVRYLSVSEVQAPSLSDRAKLVFHRYGDQYFLYQVWSSGTDTGMQTYKHRAEQELQRAQANPVPSNTEVATSGAPQR